MRELNPDGMWLARGYVVYAWLIRLRRGATVAKTRLTQLSRLRTQM